MKALVFLGGEAPEPSRLASILSGAHDVVAAADSGLAIAEACGFRPDIIAGDFDSLDDPERLSAYPEGSVFRFPADKDDTDAVLAIRLCLARGADSIDIVGGGGGRVDHFLDLLALLGKESAIRRWYLPGNILETIDPVSGREGPTRNFSSFPGEVVSLFAIGNDALEAGSEGLFWPLSGLVFKPGEGSMSNRVTGGGFGITIFKGRGLLVRGYPEA